MTTDLRYSNVMQKAPCFTVDWFKWVHGSFGKGKGMRPGRIDNNYLMELAATQGCIESLKWLRDQGVPVLQDCGHRAAEGGHTEVLEWLRSKGYTFSVYTSSAAAKGGKLETLKWLRDQRPRCPWNPFCCSSAAAAGHLHLLQWAIRNGCQYSIHSWDEAKRAGQTKVLEWLKENTSLPGSARSPPSNRGHSNRRPWLRR